MIIETGEANALSSGTNPVLNSDLAEGKK